MTADWLFPALRFAQYAVLLGLFGSLAFRMVGLQGLTPFLRPATGRVTMLAALAAPCITVAVMLVGIARMMGQALGDLDGATITAMVMTTDMGTAFLARTALATVAAAVLVLVRPARRSQIIAAWLYALALLTLAWNGHAAASEGWPGLAHRLNDATHLLAAALWIGAIGWFSRLVWTAHRDPARIRPAPLLDVLHRFAPLGLALVAVVALTGTINAHFIFGIENSLAVLQTSYGWLLAAKLVLVAFMLGCAARHARAAAQSAGASGREPAMSRAGLAQLRASLVAELLLAGGVLGLTAFAGLAAPMAG